MDMDLSTKVSSKKVPTSTIFIKFKSSANVCMVNKT